MNIRYFETNDGVWWFGGGIDLTPHYVDVQQASFFHKALKEVCDSHHDDYYPKFKSWADNYFFVKHRNETRGIGGIFFDRLNQGGSKEDFDLTSPEWYLNRELTWLYFNKRVLNEARDEQILRQVAEALVHRAFELGIGHDRLKIVADGVNSLRDPERSFVLITHYQRLLNYIVPDVVHVMVNGRIVRSGGKELAQELEEKGYAEFDGAAA